jgi:hypothetical protein
MACSLATKVFGSIGNSGRKGNQRALVSQSGNYVSRLSLCILLRLYTFHFTPSLIKLSAICPNYPFFCYINTDFVDVDHDFCQSIDKGHGRLEIRRCWTLSNLDYLTQLPL